MWQKFDKIQQLRGFIVPFNILGTALCNHWAGSEEKNPDQQRLKPKM